MFAGFGQFLANRLRVKSLVNEVAHRVKERLLVVYRRLPDVQKELRDRARMLVLGTGHEPRNAGDVDAEGEPLGRQADIFSASIARWKSMLAWHRHPQARRALLTVKELRVGKHNLFCEQASLHACRVQPRD